MPRVVKQEGDDPDPTPYLFVSLEQKRIDQTKPYDAKKACWVPDEGDGFVQGEIRGTKGDLVTVALPSGDVSFYKILKLYLFNYLNFVLNSYTFFSTDKSTTRDIKIKHIYSIRYSIRIMENIHNR